jgi:hypothetical protein
VYLIAANGSFYSVTIRFNSAKVLVAGEPNVSYICSRYYRAPELIFGATNYTTNIGKVTGFFLSGSLSSGLFRFFYA